MSPGGRSPIFRITIGESLLITAAVAALLALLSISPMLAFFGIAIAVNGFISRLLSRKPVGWFTGCLIGTSFAVIGGLLTAFHPYGFVLGGLIGAYFGARIATKEFV